MQSTPPAAESHIRQTKGISLLPGFKIKPLAADKAAPPPIMIALPSPDAAPARCGRTDSMPAVALGMVIPLPKPTKVIKPKKLVALP